jgi:hypothetical protein
MVSKFLKCLYNLRQSPQVWYEIFYFILFPKIQKDLVNSNIYLKQPPHGGFQILVIYVNDYVFVSNSLNRLSL